MTFDDAQAVESLCWQLKQSDWPRALNRTRINKIFNGHPPYSEDEVAENNINVNVNDLSATRLAHDARSQFYQAFCKPGAYFKATTDFGAQHKRNDRSSIVTKEVAKLMKRSIPYFEKHRATFAQNVLHGIGPGVFRDSDRWCPEPMGVEDVLIPANTNLTMYNLPFFVVYRSFTAPELIRLTQGPKVDPGWNKKLVKAAIKWVDEQTSKLLNNDQWPQMWSPEKQEERIKGSGGCFYMGDSAPTINCWDLYYWNDAKDVQGWNRRMVIDAWSTPDMAAGVTSKLQTSVRAGMEDMRSDFIYNPKGRKFASRREEIINWQFADLSAVAPFQYHSIRSLGFLLYAVCHLQNRLRCKFNESVFEQLMILFRVKSQDDMQRALKVDLINKGFVDETLSFIPAKERYQVNTQLAELGLRENNTLIQQNASSYSPQMNGPSQGPEKTKFQVMSEVTAVTSLVSAGLQQAYTYQVPEYREIFRRFCKRNSPDPDVRTFQANCLRQGVPESLLRAECWEIEPERVMGAGNKTLEMSIAQQLMQFRNLYDPEPQRQILHDVTLAITDDAARADALVPSNPNQVSDSKFAASLAAGTLMQGLPVPMKTGMNHIEYVETLLTALATLVKKYQNQVPPPDDILGMQNVAAHIAQHIQLIAQDPNEKARVKQYNDALGKLMNEVKAFAQRYVEQQKQQAQQQGGGEQAAETQAKIQSIKVMADAKAANTRESHAQRTAQRQIQFEMQQQQRAKEFELQLAMKEKQAQIDLQFERAKVAQELEINEAKGEQEVRHAEAKAKATAKAKPAKKD